MKLINLLIILLVSTKIGYSQNSDDVVIAKSLKINSKVLGEERTMYISTPYDYAYSNESYPVLYVLDDWIGIIGLANNLSAFGLCPDMIVVVIKQVNPGRDLFPSQPKYMRGLNPAKRWYSEKDNNDLVLTPPCEICGHADKFLSFVETELFPFIDKNYRTIPYRICTGHSMGGLCVTYAFLSYTNMFNAYIALSPPLYWDDGLLMRTAGEKLLGKNLKYKQFYFSIGAKEDPTTIGDVHDFAQILKFKASKELTWKFDYMENEDHSSGATNGIINGLRFIYDGWKYDNEIIMAGGLDAINSFYRTQSDKFGYEITPRATTLNSIGWQILREGRNDEAIKILEMNTLKHPNFPEAFSYLGSAYLKIGNNELAVKNFEKAVDLAIVLKDENLERYKTLLDRAKISKKQN
jgi:predicted alpha/beta superfamily hydrolase